MPHPLKAFIEMVIIFAICAALLLLFYVIGIGLDYLIKHIQERWRNK